jgi:hypothetical protein
MGRTYIGLKIPHTWGLINNPRIHVVYRDIHLRPHRGNREQGDQRREEFQGEHGREVKKERGLREAYGSN